MCGFLHFAPSLMTFCVRTLCWSLGTTQYKVVANNYVTACLTLFSNTLLRFHHVIRHQVVIGVVVPYCHTVSLQTATHWDVKSMQCDSVFAYEEFCTNGNPSPIGVGVWSIWNINGKIVHVVHCFQQWWDMLMMRSDADVQLCPLHSILRVMHMPVSQRMDALRLLTSTEIDIQFGMCTALSRSNWIIEKCTHAVYNIFVNCSWVDTRWQHSTHLHTNSTQNNTMKTEYTEQNKCNNKNT